jgi:hypothetical protein
VVGHIQTRGVCRVLFSRANTVDIRHRKTLLDFSMYRLTKFQSGKKKKEKGSKLVSKPNWARGAEAELVV